MKKYISIVVLLALLVLVAALATQIRKGAKTAEVSDAETGTKVAYACNEGKTVVATYIEGAPTAAQAPGEMPVPTGKANIKLSDGRTLALAQTISADGVRYSNGDESFVFWNKGNGALILENNAQSSFVNCLRVASPNLGDPTPLTKIFHAEPGSISKGFVVSYPEGYTPTAPQEMNKDVAAVNFTIPKAVTRGTNLSSDSFVSVEQLRSVPPEKCSAEPFLIGHANLNYRAVSLDDHDTHYSYGSSTDAAAGNRYEDHVYAISGSSPCTAVRYRIHWGVYENYPAGAVKQFDHDALVHQFDAIRRSLVLGQ